MRDHHEGQRVSRRTAVAGLSSIGLTGLLAACTGGSPAATTAADAITPQTTTASDLTGLFSGAGTCTLTPVATQGPYYFDAGKVRSDIREDRQGARLRMVIKLQESEQCTPLPNAVVEIWHCDAAGLYSGAEATSTGGDGGPPPGRGGEPPGGRSGEDGSAHMTPIDDKRYLRGAQVTNADGIVEFTTIWPGWYRGRTVHVHAMVHVDNERVLTTQVMFDEALNAEVFATEPYTARTGRETFNDGDSIFRESMLLKITEEADGYLGVIVFSADADRDGA